MNSTSPHISLTEFRFKFEWTPSLKTADSFVTCAGSSINLKTARSSRDANEYVIKAASDMLGADFNFNPPSMLDDSEPTGLAIYDILTKVLPTRSPQSTFFWRKFAKCFASMLDTALYPISTQISFLTFIYARLLGMMGPIEPNGPGSLMTYDGSPVELSWVLPSHDRPAGQGSECRQLRFAIEPIDPRSGKLLKGKDVLEYFSSPNGGLGLVKCDKSSLDWSFATQNFVCPEDENEEQSGMRFFIGFDFSRSGDIVLKTYHIPASHTTHGAGVNLWDVDYSHLRDLVSLLEPGLMKSLDTLISYAADVDIPYKPRLQILSSDCVPHNMNRLKLYCRPARGNSWSDARHAFTLGGRLASPRMDYALSRLEALWNLLFPYAHSSSDHDLDDASCIATARSFDDDGCHRRHAEHPTSGLLYYYSLVPGSNMILPKIYLPVSRYCPNDLFIAQALEDFHNAAGHVSERHGWVSKEVSAAYDHRALSEKTGIHTYVTFAVKSDYRWELTSYFSPEVWEK